ncbi:MAG: hypothetical protein HY289_08560 [Planctomycetes bacterium]|nr:hypothetical protein [Planctomycetota bacterium]
MWTFSKPEILSRLPRHGANGALHRGVATAQSIDHSGDDWDKRIEEVSAFRECQHDWDGQGAEAASAELLQSAVHLANMLRTSRVDPPACVVLGVNGTVIFEWQWEDGAYLEIEVTEPHHAEACLIAPGQAAEHWILQ